MQYRRFGRTELQMPVLSCGGMRYQQGWKDLPFEEITRESQENLEATIQAALAAGISHIETARGYGSSEVQLGRILPELPRDEMIVQTKVAPQDDGPAFRRVFEDSMSKLRLDRVDLLALHGVNNRELLEKSLKKGGSLDEARRIQEEGLADHIGFSTHAPLDVILDAINTDGFDYVNLHWYWVDQVNAPALDAARAHDMGLFIISPSDKGGKLYSPPRKLIELTQPLTPMGFNDLWCLWRDDVHTLSIGAARPTDFQEHLDILHLLGHQDEVLPPILERLDTAAEEALGREWLDQWQTNLPLPEDVPGEVNLYQVLRLYNLAKAYEMTDYAKTRYNLFGNGGHWFAGNKVDQLDWDALPGVIAESPVAERIPEVLREAHAMLNAEDKKRLSQGG